MGESTMIKKFSFQAAITALLCLLAVFVFGFSGQPAAAEIDDQPLNNFWGVDGIASAQTNNFNAQVWAIEQIGNVMYVGGKFTDVRGGATRYPRPYIAAFEASTGKWLDWWTPDFNGPVYALRASADGSTLFVGGEFTTVNGANVPAFAAIDPITGDNVTSWTTRVNGGGPAVVREIKLGDDGQLYVVGGFNNASQNGQVISQSNAVRINPSTGAIDTGWRPDINGGGVWDVAFGSNRVYLGGFFTNLNNKSGTFRFGPVRQSDGGQVSGVNGYTPNEDVNGTRGRVYALAAVNGSVFVAGEEHAVQVLNESDLSRRYVHFTGQPANEGWALSGGGDYQDLEVVGNRVYASCHCWNQHLDADNGNLYPTTAPGPGTWTPVRSVIAYNANTGKKIDSFAPILNGSSGVWAIKGHSTDGCLWVGGQLTQSGGRPAYNLARLCDSAGPGPAAGPPVQPPADPPPPAPTACTALLEGSNIRLSWGPSDGADRYVVRRSRNGGSLSWLARVDAPGVSRLDTSTVVGSSYAYTVEAINSDGTSARTDCGPAITIPSQGISAPASCTATVGATEYTITFAGVANANRYVIRRSRDGGAPSWLGRVTAPGTSFTRDLPPLGSVYTYTIEAISGSGEVSLPTSCGTIDRTSVLGGAIAPTSCVATQTSATRYDLSWTPAANDNAVRYVVRRSRDGGAYGWAGSITAPGTSFTNTAPAGSSYAYTVEARGADGSVAVTNCVTEPLPDDSAIAPVSCSATAVNGGTAVQLNWVRAANDNAEFFIVRRSRNGNDFSWAGRIDAPGTSFTNNAPAGSYTYTVESRGADGSVASVTCEPSIQL